MSWASTSPYQCSAYIPVLFFLCVSGLSIIIVLPFTLGTHIIYTANVYQRVN